MMHCVAMGHEIVALANLYPAKNGESDSYMYQTVGCEAIEMYSDAMDIPLFRREIKGYSKEVNLTYNPNNEDEVEDLYCLLKDIQDELSFDAVSSGAILSDYQRIRVENVCSRLNLVSLAYMWRRDQKMLLQEMIENGLVAVIIKTAALGLVPNIHLGQNLAQIQPHLVMLNNKYGSHICGEGGEYETFTLDCPMFRKRIFIDESEIIIHSDDGVTSVAYLLLKSLRLVEKDSEQFSYKSLVPLPFEFERIPPAQNLNCTDLPVDFNWKKSLLSSSLSDQYPLLAVKVNGAYASISNLFGICKSSFSEDDIINCTKKTFEKLRELLDDIQHNLADVVNVYFCLADMKHFSLVNSVYKTFFQLNPPSRVCISPLLSSSDLGDKDHAILFQIDCVSYKETSGHSKKVMHVQGISHWAPANIGPYSQCTSVDGLYFVAGQIGLIPGTMAMVDGGIDSEAHLSLQHVKSVLSAMDSTLSLANTAQCICYICDSSYLNVVRSVWAEAVGHNEDLLNKVVYMVVKSLPRQAMVEWQIVAVKLQENVSTSSVILCHDIVETLDFSWSMKTLSKKFLSQMESRDCKPTQIRLFYAKQNLLLCEIEDVQRNLTNEYTTLPSIAWIPAQMVYTHYTYVSMALVGLAVSDFS